MALTERLLDIAQEIDTVKIQRLTPYDEYLPHIELDPEQAHTHPNLFKVDREELTQAIDTIYIAADAGDVYAKFLIMAAAANAQNSAYDDIRAFGKDLLEIPADVLEGYERMNSSIIKHTAPKAPLDEIVEIDRSLAIVELAFEDAERDGWQPPLTD